MNLVTEMWHGRNITFEDSEDEKQRDINRLSVLVAKLEFELKNSREDNSLLSALHRVSEEKNEKLLYFFNFIKESCNSVRESGYDSDFFEDVSCEVDEMDI